MAVYFNTEHLPAFTNPVITIGTFDGVHHGHRQILEEVVDYARSIGGESIVITFEPHPRKLLFPDRPIKLLTPLKQKLELITGSGIEHIVVVPFSREFSELSARQYVGEFLVGKFRPKCIIIGYDHHFGHDRTGNIGLLRQLQADFGYEVREIPAQLIDEAAVSSTKIRNAIAEGKVEEAAHMLGRSYGIAGKVVEGAKLGRTIGYPTANIEPLDAEQILPGKGIYAARVNFRGNIYDAMLSIGYNPTVTDKKELKIEVHIFSFSESIYGEELEIFFIRYLRTEEKFDSLDALKEQLHKDKEAALQALSQG